MKYFIGLLPFLMLGLLIASVIIRFVGKIKRQKDVDRKLKELEEERWNAE